jgi:hypothetical protein
MFDVRRYAVFRSRLYRDCLFRPPEFSYEVYDPLIELKAARAISGSYCQSTLAAPIPLYIRFVDHNQIIFTLDFEDKIINIRL